MKVAEKKNSADQLDLGIDADLQLQRDYVKELDEQKFEYGLVLANAFVKGMRDIGYKSTAYALNELNDNAIQAGAKRVHTIFGYDSPARKKPVSLALIDDGHGMDPGMIRAAVVWGGTHRQDDRNGWGRYGYGLPSACVSIGKRYTVYSKVLGAEWSKVSIDLDDIEAHFKKRIGGAFIAPIPSIEAPPSWVASYIKDTFGELKSGSIVLIEKIDRLDYWTTENLRRELLQDFGTTYRNFISSVSMAVDGREVEATDPLFLKAGFRYYDVDTERAEEYPSLEVPIHDKEADKDLGTIKVRFSYMPPSFLRTPETKEKPKGGKHNDRFAVRKANNGILVLRAGRQIDVVNAKCPWTTFQNNDRYVGIEVDFPPTLDEYFSITTAKQQVLIKEKIWGILETAGVYRAISAMRTRYDKESKELARKWEDKCEQAKLNSGQEVVEDPPKRPSEEAFEEARSLFAQPVTAPSADQQAKSQENVESAANKLSEQAGLPKSDARRIIEARAKKQPFVVEYEDHNGAPFYRVEQRGAQMVLFINKGHKFHTSVYASPHSNPHMRYALESLLFVMGDCELKASGVREAFYVQERTAWSVNLNTQLGILDDKDTARDVAASEAEKTEAEAAAGERHELAKAV